MIEVEPEEAVEEASGLRHQASGAEPEPERRGRSRRRSPNRRPNPSPSRSQSPNREPVPAAEQPTDEQPTVQHTALEHAPWLEQESQPDPPAEENSVTEIVDDLLVPGEPADAIQDATVVEAELEEEPPDDDALAEAARAALADQPDIELEVRHGALTLTRRSGARRGDH